MCTVTVVPRLNGFRLACNRDERETRRVAMPPRCHPLERRVAAFPVDPESGGTWIGVSDAALALAVLNRTDQASAPTAGRGGRSRGLIIPALLDCDSVKDALAEACRLDASSFDPFYLVAVQGTEVGVVASDGRVASTFGSTLSQPMLFTTSSRGDALVEPPRRRLFEQTVLGADSWLDGQARFHRHRWPDRPELSVWMSRPGFRTVSCSVVDVTRSSIGLFYEPVDRLEAAPPWPLS